MYKAARSLGFAFAAIYGVAQSRTQLKRLSSSSSILACQGKVKPSDPSARVVGGWPYPLNETAMVATMKWSPPDTRSHAKRVAHGITFLNILSPEANTGHTFTNGNSRFRGLSIASKVRTHSQFCFAAKLVLLANILHHL